MTRMTTLWRVLYRQDVEIGTAVVLGVSRTSTIRLGGGRPSILKTVRFLQLLGRLED